MQPVPRDGMHRLENAAQLIWSVFVKDAGSLVKIFGDGDEIFYIFPGINAGILVRPDCGFVDKLFI